jgi:transcriptional regulator with XRE-family HTH domain
MYGSIGMNLKVLRLRNQLKQREIAKTLGVSIQLIGLYERNEVLPTEENLKKLAQLYGVKLEDITEENR